LSQGADSRRTAKAATDEQILLRRRARRRLIGAIALVTVIAVVLPWVLESEPRPNDQDVSIQIPSPETPFKSKVVPDKPAVAPAPDAKEPVHEAKESGQEAKESAPEPASGTAPPAVETLKSEQDKVLAPVAPKTTSGKDKAARAKETKPAAPEPKKKGTEHKDTADSHQFVVQIAALADAEKAQSIQKELRSKGLKSYTEVVKAAAGEVTRVRVGPFATREGAEQERARLKSLGFEGNVTPR
jgi:DedD protein